MSTFIDLAPTWQGATRVYIEVLKNPNADSQAHIDAEKELLRLAYMFDSLSTEEGARRQLQAVLSKKESQTAG